MSRPPPPNPNPPPTTLGEIRPQDGWQTLYICKIFAKGSALHVVPARPRREGVEKQDLLLLQCHLPQIDRS